MPIGKRLGRSRSHRVLINAVAEFLSAYPECLLIVPNVSAGEELAHRSGGAAGLHRLTLVQLALELARPVIADLGLAPLTSLGLEALAARVIYAARAENELAYFSPVAAFPGFAPALAKTISELRMARVQPDALAASGAPGADLAKLLMRYQSELESRALADTARAIELATAADDSRWLGLPVAFLDVPIETPVHREFFSRIASRAPALLIAAGSGEEVFEELLGISSEDLDRDSSSNSSLEHLRKYLFSASPPACEAHDRGLELFSSPGEGLEAVEIARRILSLAREGTAFDQIAILLRSPERYQPMIEDALRRARIPAYFSCGTARPDAGGRAFLALLACVAEKCPAARFAEYLSLGQVPAANANPKEWVAANDEMLPAADAPEPPEPDESAPRAPGSWEKLLIEAAVIGGRDRWERRLRGLEREFELRLKVARDDDTHREHLARRLDQLRELERFALPLIDYLDALPREAHWKEWIEHLSGLARMALRRPEPVLAVLAEFEPMGEVGPASIEEVAAVLSDRLRFLRSDPPRRRYGHVFAGSIEEARGREFAVVFLPGLAEGLFPQRATEDPLLLDNFRNAMETMLPLRDDKVRRERVLLQLAAGAARDRLIASYPRMDVAEARPRVPSFYALELPRAIEGRLPELREIERRAREASRARLNWPAPPETAAAIDDIEYDLAALAKALKNSTGGRYLVEVNEHVSRSLRARWRRWEIRKWTEADGLIANHRTALDVLAEHRLNARAWSPSSLQRFAVCPYQFALGGIYGLRPREEASPIEQLDPLTRGALFHEAQFALLTELNSRGLLPVNPKTLAAALELCDAALTPLAARYEEELAPAIPRIWKSEIEDLRTDLRGWLQHAARNDDDWTPVHFEFGFGLADSADRDPASTSEDADLSEIGVRLRGSIDLVERNAARGVLRVTDHKTGKPPDAVPLAVGGGRFLQPLLYGLAAEKFFGTPVESGRLFYATQRGEYRHMKINNDGRARLVIARLLANIDQAIAGGFLPPLPQSKACEMCDYAVACGPYEERRSRLKNQNDERIEGLIEIRGMA